MSSKTKNRFCLPRRDRSCQGNARVFSLLLGSLLLAGAVSGFWLYHSRPARANRGAGGAFDHNTALSAATLSVLKHLDKPLQIRFYCSVDAGSASAPVQALGGRVEQLLAAYERAAGGKISVSWFNSPTNFDTYAAASDGMKPFTEKGTEFVLGIALVEGDKKESLSQLSPDWEQALEPDLTRAIVRLNDANHLQPAAAVAANSATLEEIKHALPNLNAVSVEDGTRTLREAALKDFKAATSQYDAQIKEAEQRITDAQNKSETEQQAALKHLLDVQAEQVQKLKDIAARSKAQVEAFQQLKQTNR